MVRFGKRYKFGYPRKKTKRDNYQSYRTNFTNNNIAFDGTHIKLPKLGRVRIRGGKTLVPEGRILSATVRIEPDGRYYISICATDVPAPVLEHSEDPVGIDLGIKDLAILSDVATSDEEACKMVEQDVKGARIKDIACFGEA